MFDPVESILFVNETERYILPTLYVSLNYCSEIVNSFPGTLSCHKATLGFTDHIFNFMFVSFDDHVQRYLQYMAHQTKCSIV